MPADDGRHFNDEIAVVVVVVVVVAIVIAQIHRLGHQIEKKVLGLNAGWLPDIPVASSWVWARLF